jgi:hypothetical protein
MYIVRSNVTELRRLSAYSDHSPDQLLDYNLLLSLKKETPR